MKSVLDVLDGTKNNGFTNSLDALRAGWHAVCHRAWTGTAPPLPPLLLASSSLYSFPPLHNGGFSTRMMVFHEYKIEFVAFSQKHSYVSKNNSTCHYYYFLI